MTQIKKFESIGKNPLTPIQSGGEQETFIDVMSQSHIL